MADITPEIASKVLSADLRNLIKKISDGGNLSSPERELMQGFIGTVELTEDHARLRISSLLRKWSLGQRLSKDELSEISGLLPDTSEISKRKTKETYNKKLEEYEPIYGQKPNRARTIKRWISTGRKTSPPDLPPLDEPSMMPSWWVRHMKQKVPAKVLAAAGQHQPKPTAPAQPSAPSDPVQPSTAPPQASSGGEPSSRRPPRRPVETHEVGFAAKLKQAEQDVANALADKEAAEDADPQSAADIELADRKYDRAMKRYREFQRDAEDIISREERAWTEAEQHLSEPLNVMNQSLRSIMVRVATKAGLPKEWFDRIEPAYQDELDTVFTNLAEADYESAAEPFELQSA